MTRDERLARLESQILDVNDRQQFLAEQLSEQTVRIRFLMTLLKVRVAKTTQLLGPDERPINEQPLVDAYVAYMRGGREKMLEILEAEYKENVARMEAMEADEDNRDEGDSEAPSGDPEPTPTTDGDDAAGEAPSVVAFPFRTTH